MVSKIVNLEIIKKNFYIISVIKENIAESINILIG